MYMYVYKAGIQLWCAIEMNYLQRGQYELPGGAQYRTMTVGQI